MKATWSWGCSYHSGKYSCYGLLGCDIVSFDLHVPTLQRNLPPPASEKLLQVTYILKMELVCSSKKCWQLFVIMWNTSYCTYTANETSGTVRYMRWERIFSPSNSTVCFFICCSFKGWLPNKAFITQNTQTPQVNLFIMGLTLDHFWWKVIQGTTQCVSPGKRPLTGEVTSIDTI